MSGEVSVTVLNLPAVERGDQALLGVPLHFKPGLVLQKLKQWAVDQIVKVEVELLDDFVGVAVLVEDWLQAALWHGLAYPHDSEFASGLV